MSSNIIQIRLTSRQKIRPRFSNEIFNSSGDEEGEGETETKAHPSSVEFPKFAFPVSLIADAGAGKGWDEEGCDDCDDDGWEDEGEYD
jgi:hypothetical protein